MSGRLRDDGGILEGPAEWARRLDAAGLPTTPDAATIDTGWPATLTAYTGSGRLVSIHLNPGWLSLESGVPVPDPNPTPWFAEVLRAFEALGHSVVPYQGPDLDGVYGNVALLQWHSEGPISSQYYNGPEFTVAVTLLYDPPPPE